MPTPDCEHRQLRAQNLAAEISTWQAKMDVIKGSKPELQTELRTERFILCPFFKHLSAHRTYLLHPLPNQLVFGFLS